MSRKVTIRLPDRTQETLGQIREGEVTQRIVACLARYERICRELMPTYSKGEWCAIMDANNGGTDIWLAAEVDYPSGTGIWANVHDSVGLGEKWEIDQKKLVKKLQRLSPAELLAVDEAIARFWNHTELETDQALKVSWCKMEGE